MNPGHEKINSLSVADGLRFVQADYRTAFSMPTHCHEDAACLAFSLAGNVEEIQGRRAFAVAPRSLTFLPRGLPHANRFGAGASVFLAVMSASYLERFAQLPGGLDSPHYAVGGRAAWVAARMHREFRRRDALTSLTLEGLTLELLAEILRDQSALAPDSAPRWLQQTRDYLHAHFTQHITTDALAAAVGVHPAHLMRGFRQKYGCTVGDYVRQLRVEYACRLLSAARLPLAQIAIEAGFADQSHFNRAFKNHTGMTPTEYQRQSGAIPGQQTHF